MPDNELRIPQSVEPSLESETETEEVVEPLQPPAYERGLERVADAVYGEQEKPHPHSELDELFAVPEPEDNDIYCDDLFEFDEEDLELEDDLSDLTQVTVEDVMGAPPKPKLKPRYRLTGKRYVPPPNMGGVR